MKVIVCGGRDYEDYVKVSQVLSNLNHVLRFTAVAQGGARGADMLARRWAMENNIPVEQYDADWKKYGKAAGIIRNQEMLEESGAEIVVAFPGGKGTWDMIRRASNAPGVEVVIITEDEEQLDLPFEKNVQ